MLFIFPYVLFCLEARIVLDILGSDNVGAVEELQTAAGNNKRTLIGVSVRAPCLTYYCIYKLLLLVRLLVCYAGCQFCPYLQWGGYHVFQCFSSAAACTHCRFCVLHADDLYERGRDYWSVERAR